MPDWVIWVAWGCGLVTGAGLHKLFVEKADKPVNTIKIKPTFNKW